MNCRSASGEANVHVLVLSLEREHFHVIITWFDAISHELLNCALQSELRYAEFLQLNSGKIAMRNVNRLVGQRIGFYGSIGRKNLDGSEPKPNSHQG